eukprot:scaffold9654_cov61-Phaeocystis_antarctica.AAC.2
MRAASTRRGCAPRPPRRVSCRRRSLRGGRLSKARPARVSSMAEQDLPGVCARLGFEACVAYW